MRGTGVGRPGDAAAGQVALGIAKQGGGDLEGAVACFREAIAADPGCFAAYNALGGVFAGLRDWATALLFVRAAGELQPGSAEIQGNVGHLQLKLGEVAGAVESYRRAAALRPREARYANSLGHALLRAREYEEAEAWMRRAVALEPGYAEGYANLGFLAWVMGRPAEEVEGAYREAIGRRPELAQAHVNLSHSLLRRGAFAEGWSEQEWRWRWEEFPSPKRGFNEPQWRGEAIAGERMLLHAEQGFGDAIQFLRYVPLVTARGVRVILEVHPELKTLAAASFAGVEVIGRGEALPAFAWHCPLLSLPLAFGTEEAGIPAEMPYLRADEDGPAWLEKLPGLRVGLVWAGGAINLVDGERTLTLGALEPLWGVAGVAWYGLQRGPASAEAESVRFAGVQPQTGDFRATAAAIRQLDLVVSVDTSVAHLAGALGKPVWILLPARADWRWMTEREDSPWYPTARLFRQEVAGDWGPVIERVTEELAREAARRV